MGKSSAKLRRASELAVSRWEISFVSSWGKAEITIRPNMALRKGPSEVLGSCRIPNYPPLTLVFSKTIGRAAHFAKFPALYSTGLKTPSKPTQMPALLEPFGISKIWHWEKRHHKYWISIASSHTPLLIPVFSKTIGRAAHFSNSLHST